MSIENLVKRLVEPLHLRSVMRMATADLLSLYTANGIRPSGVLDFGLGVYVGKNGLVTDASEIVTYVTPGLALMTDSDGFQKWNPHNLLPAPVSWSNTPNTTVTENQEDPDGGTEASKVTHDDVSSSFYEAVSVVSGVQYTLRTKIRVDNGARWVRVFVASKTVFLDADSGYAEGATPTTDSTTVTSLGGGWYSIEVIATAGTTGSTIFGAQLQVNDGSSNEDDTGDMYLYETHAYRSDQGGMAPVPVGKRVAGSETYVPTTSSAVYLPRENSYLYDASTSSWVNNGLFHESEARTNLIENSQDFDAGSYGGIVSIVVPSYADSPIGSNAATRLIDDNAGGTGTVGWADASTIVTVSTTYTFWAILKKDQLSWAYLEARAFTTPDNVQTYFDLENGIVGTVGAGHTAHMKGFGNGWYLCGITFTTDVADTSGQPRVYASSANATPSVDRDGTSSILMAAWQFEQGSTPSSYIPTAGATVTRAADAMTIPAANLPWNPLAVSIQMEGTMTYADEGGTEVTWFDWRLNSLNYIQANLRTQSAATGEVYHIQAANGISDDVDGRSSQYSPGINVPFNIASRHGSTFINGAVDGTALTADTTPTALPYLENTDMQIGYDFMGHIQELTLFDVDVGDTGLEEITTFTFTDEFAMTITTTAANETFTIPCQNVGVFDAAIQWGDNSTSTITAYNDTGLTHTFATAGDHTIRITGTFPNIYFNNGGDKLKVKRVDNLGDVGWATLNRAFFGCSNMELFAAGTTDTSSVTNMDRMFRDCSSLTSLDVTGFDTSSVTNMSYMFQNCSSLTSLDVTSFDTSSVTSMDRMFRDCSSLTSLDVTSFDTSGVTNMGAMFRGCSSLTSLDVTGFDTSSVMVMGSMFYICSLLTSLDVTGFDTSSVTDMNSMFRNCLSLTDVIGVEDFNIEGLNSTGDLTDFMTSVTLPTARYDALLVNWDAQEPFDGMSPNFGNSTYTAGSAAATARANLISNDGWIIADGGTA